MNAGHVKLAQLDAQRDPLAEAWARIAEAVAEGEETLHARAEAGEREHNARVYARRWGREAKQR